MPQFAVYRNKYLQGSGVYPLLVDVQSELLEDLATTVVIPLAKSPRYSQFPLMQVMPTIEIDGERYMAVTTRLAGVSRSDLGPRWSSAAAHQRTLLGAVDVLLRGF